ncbi:MAG: NfeD family protein [Kiritimatiellaeota bacterium]|nr:NfeD family protein [Kiritimatiellota bacterium]
MSAIGWVFLGVVFLVLEVAAPGLISVFFGMAALVVALVTWTLAPSPTVQWLLFSVFSVLSLFLLRRMLRKTFVGEKSAAENVEDDFVGKSATVVEPVLPSRAGRVEFRGCSWTAESDEEIPTGTTVRICSKANITLFVKRV